MVKLSAISIIVSVLCACTPPVQLEAVNAAANAHPYVAGRYECVQYVEEKAARLLAEGFDPSNLAIVYGTWHQQEHVILRVRWWGHLWYLDNIDPHVRDEPGIIIIHVFERTKFREDN